MVSHDALGIDFAYIRYHHTDKMDIICQMCIECVMKKENFTTLKDNLLKTLSQKSSYILKKKLVSL